MIVLFAKKIPDKTILSTMKKEGKQIAISMKKLSKSYQKCRKETHEVTIPILFIIIPFNSLISSSTRLILLVSLFVGSE